MAGGKGRRDDDVENDGPVKRPRRSDRLAHNVLRTLQESNSLPNAKAGVVGNRSVSAPKQRAGDRIDQTKRLSAPVKFVGKAVKDLPLYQAGFGSLPAELLSTVINQLSPRDTASARLVCRAWKQGVDDGLQRLSSDSAWIDYQLKTACKKFPAVRSLDLNAAQAINNLELLRDFYHLRHLRLVRAASSHGNEVAATLGKLRQLVTLCLVTTWAVYRLNLTGYNKLERLDLTGCTLLRVLTVPAPLPKLTCLCLRECRNISDWGFLQKLPALQALDLSYTETDDDTLSHVQTAKRLSLLVIMHCRKVTDRGLAHFNAMPNLRNVHIDGCSSTTEDARASLQKDNPNLNLIAYCF